MSKSFQEFPEIEWIKKGTPLGKDSATFFFNQNPNNISSCLKKGDDTEINEWFGGKCKAKVTEQILGLGEYGKTLTVLLAEESSEELEEEKDLEESYQARFRR